MVRRGGGLGSGRWVARGESGAALYRREAATVLGVMSGDTEHNKAQHQHTRARFTFEDMLSNRYRLDQINDALEAMRAFREVKPVVVP